MSDERNAMSSFWKEHSKDATIEEMFLDSSGQEIAKIEQPEILHMLPDYKGKRILELGAGIGRHTGEIAEKALHVTAVDFMENFVQKNKQANGKHQNVEFLCADVTQLERDPESYDIIFSNWLLMYLGDKEVHQLLNKMLTWLTEGGQLFFHESCFGQSGDKERTTNPTNYRSPMARMIFCSVLYLYGSSVHIVGMWWVGVILSPTPTEMLMTLYLLLCLPCVIIRLQLLSTKKAFCENIVIT